MVKIGSDSEKINSGNDSPEGDNSKMRLQVRQISMNERLLITIRFPVAQSSYFN
jgi:hypothetical protein